MLPCSHYAGVKLRYDSLLNYVGHKSKIIEQIKTYLPPTLDGEFYDCFAGSCVVGLNVNYPRVSFVEYNEHLSNLYRDLIKPDFHKKLTALITQYGLTNSSVTPRSEYLKDPNIGHCQWMGETITNLHLDQLNKAGYNRLLADFNAGKFADVDKSCAYMLATIYGRNSSVTTKHDGTLSGAVGPLDYSIRCNQKLSEHINRLSSGNYTFINGSYDSITPNADDFVYCDPPYLASNYRYSGWEEADEAKFLAWLKSVPCRWALSNTLQSGDKINHLLTEFSKDYYVVELNKKYRKWGGAGKETSKTKTKVNREVLILSYEPTWGPGLISNE